MKNATPAEHLATIARLQVKLDAARTADDRLTAANIAALILNEKSRLRAARRRAA